LSIKITKLGKQLILYGTLLFLIGLIQGAFIPYFHNPRMALSAHLAAVQSGMAMLIFGIIWALLNLKNTALKVAYYTNIIGMYAIWLAITLSAALGASRALPIAGKGFSASIMTETIIEAIIIFGSISAIISVGLILLGLFNYYLHTEK